MKKSKSSKGASLIRSGPIPLYHQLSTKLREEILDGVMETGARYYSDRELVAQYGLSLLTVRQAMSQLVEEGLLERRQGSGTFVSGKVDRLRAKTGRKDAILFVGWSPSALSGWEAMYFRDIFEGIQKEAQSHGLEILFDDLRAHSRIEITDFVRERRIRGALALVSTGVQARARQFVVAGVNVVSINCLVPDAAAIMPDDYGGGRAAVQHLISLGHRALVHLNSGEQETHWLEVKRAYLGVVAESGLSIESNPVIEHSESGGTIDAGFKAAQKLWDSGRTFSAIFTGNDLMAVGAMRFLMSKGVKIPEDVSVIGFDNIEAAEICTPRLTTVSVGRVEVGRAAVQTLLEPNFDPSTRRLLPVRIWERESTAVAKERGVRNTLLSEVAFAQPKTQSVI